MKNSIHALVVLVYFLLLSICSYAQTDWQELTVQGSCETNTVTQALIRDKAGYVYATLGTGVFKWDGNNWKELGSNNNALNANNSINSITTDASGNVYAAGSFSDSSSYAYVAKWNGTRWLEIGMPGKTSLNANGTIFSIATDAAGNVYAAGGFKNTSGKYYVAKWDGILWTELGSGLGALNANNTINSIATDKNGNVYAAGFFTNASNKRYVAKWNGTTWAELGNGTGALNANNGTYSIVVDSLENIYAAGSFTNTSGKQYVAKWNGATWAELGSGTNVLNANNTILSLAFDMLGNIYSCGLFTDTYGLQYVSKWNGSSWAEVGYGGFGGLKAVTTDGSGNVYTTGQIKNIYGNYIIAEWNGIGWFETNSHYTALNQTGIVGTIATDMSGNVYAAGNFADSLHKAYVAKWDGNIWSELGTGSTALFANAAILSVITDPTGNVYAAGAFTNASGKRYVAKWNGNTWNELGGGTIGALFANNNIFSTVIDKSGNIYAAGIFTNSVGKYYVAKWNGTSWAELGNGSNALNANSEILTMATDTAGNIYAAGGFTNSNRLVYVAKWDGSMWSQLGGGIGALAGGGGINSIAIDKKGNVYAVGADANGVNPNVVKWNGNTWSSLGSIGTGAFSPGDKITSLATDASGNVYAAEGDPSILGKTFVTKWDGNTWSNLGSGLGMAYNNNSAILSINYDTKSNSLYAGGYFENSRGLIYVAKYALNSTAILPVNILYLTGIQQKGNVLLQWQTLNETSAANFDIQRSLDGSNFITIGRVAAAGSSNIEKSYQYTDVDVSSLNIPKIYYRLVETDKDGTINISKVTDVNITGNKAPIFIGTNPVDNVINIRPTVNINNAVIKIFDMLGGTLYESTQNLQSNGLIQINSSGFAKGMYIVTVQVGKNKQVFKVVK